MRVIPLFAFSADIRRRPLFQPCGFSLPEFVAVIAIVAILAVFATSRFSGSFAGTVAFYDQLLAQVSYGRKAAVAQRRAVFVRIDGAQSRLCYSPSGACTTSDGVPSPNGAVPFLLQAPAGTSATVAVFQFDALGRYLTSAGATPAAALAISVTGDGSYQFFVEPDTGYVHP